MTGPHDSVIGSDEHNAIKRFLTGMPLRLEPATGDVRIEGVLVECGDDGRATTCSAVRVGVE
jgi:calcineurin-like phosphoesterase